MTNFDAYLKDLERELNELKTDGLKSSSSLATTEHEATITQQIVGYAVNTQYDHTASQSAAIIEIVPSDNKTMITSAYLSYGEAELTNRYAYLLPTIKNGHNAYEFRFIEGSTADLTTVNNGGTIPAITLKIVISGTSEFTTNITYRQDY